ncbi:oxidoreductase [Chitinilyticum litopenaei]|uniref:oxidoreductase n=1 Tax=Chitinilyticum litopenaei TaxID=1121276 RepID=UPI00048A4D4B|nr:oxidoreductase [Chitinilyticum litopenaei]
MPIRTALLGFGYAGRTFHLPLLQACPALAVDTILSSRHDELAAVCPQARVVSTLEAVLADPGLELVVIATPNHLHAPMAEAALRAGKHVVIDKPFAVTLAEARALAQLAESAGRLLSVFQNRRWDADFLGLQALLHSGQLGKIVQFDSQFNRFRPQVQARWREGDGPGAGLWHDLGPHLIDQALCLFGVPAAVSADIRTCRSGGLSPDWAHVELHYPDLAVLLHASMLVSGGVPRFAVHGTRGSWIKYGLDEQEAQLKAGLRPGVAEWGIDPNPNQLFADGVMREGGIDLPAGDYPAYYAAVAAAIRQQGVNPVSALEGVAVMAILEAALASAQTGLRVCPELHADELDRLSALRQG